MLTCKRCGKVEKLGKSHIIPEAFFRELREDKEMPLLVSGAYGELEKKAPIGVYDSQILCKSCEAQFSAIDSFGIDVLLKQYEKHFQPMVQHGKTVGFESTSVDKARLLQFLIAVLWRASVSEEHFYRHVELGPHETTAQEIAFSPKTPSSFGVFDALLSRWRDEQELGLVAYPLFDPRREKWPGGVNAYRLYFGEIVAYIKVDSRPFQPPLSSMSLLRSPTLKVVSRNIGTSKDFRAMVNTATKSHRNTFQFRSSHSRAKET
ncbi:hypothetical protein [Azotobacter chroococcum]|uniref:hypothetical protein n=1 Tax=Azotobacter chroococcum TaxID=353 RepID=UPI0012FE3C49|nr:hypothetical protein [Azotobacter chroococcum]